MKRYLRSTSVCADDFLTEEQKRILRNANTGGWAEMQEQVTEDAINRSGSYKNYIRDEKKSRSSVKAFTYNEDTDTYLVRIWHEVEGMRGGLPDAAEELFLIDADGPEEAFRLAKMQWDGPIDNVEIEYIRPEDKDKYEQINAATNLTPQTEEQWANYIADKIWLGNRERNALLHDLNNLRGDEWISTLIESQFPDNDLKAFKEFIGYDDNDEFEDDDDGIITFDKFVERKYGSKFDYNDLSDEEFFELEDWYRDEVPVEQREASYR